MTNSALHFGDLPSTPAVLEQIKRAHLLGFKTTMWPAYLKMTALGLGPDEYAKTLHPVFISDLA